MEAIRTRLDSNCDGVLSAADADFGKFKVMVTNADGTTVVRKSAEASRSGQFMGDHYAHLASLGGVKNLDRSLA